MMQSRAQHHDKVTVAASWSACVLEAATDGCDFSASSVRRAHEQDGVGWRAGRVEQLLGGFVGDLG